MNARRAALWALVVVAVAGALVAFGRWEGDRRADEQNAGMRRVLAAVGQLDSPSLSAFRYLTSFQCLLYRRDGNPVALELCVDEQGRLIEAIDRRSGDPKIWSVRDDGERSAIRLDRATVDRLLVREGVPQRLVDAIHARGSS